MARDRHRAPVLVRVGAQGSRGVEFTFFFWRLGASGTEIFCDQGVCVGYIIPGNIIAIIKKSVTLINSTVQTVVLIPLYTFII